MAHRPTSATDYVPESVELVRATALYIATKLGDLLDEIVIVGGLVPSLIVPQTGPTAAPSLHVGTMDVDLGLAIGLLDGQRYQELSVRLRSAGFTPDVNESGAPTNQRWGIQVGMRTITVDFLIPATTDTDQGGRLRNLEKDFAAIITPGLELAFVDRQRITLDGQTVAGDRTARDVWVCGAGALVVLKALAFDGRAENKDAYDLVYVLQNFGDSVVDVFGRLRPILENASAQRAIAILQRDFSEAELIGPGCVADFRKHHPRLVERADFAALFCLGLRDLDGHVVHHFSVFKPCDGVFVELYALVPERLNHAILGLLRLLKRLLLILLGLKP